MANKKSKKSRKTERKKLLNAPPAQLMEKGRSLIAAGNHREAIDLLKLAFKKDEANTEIKSLLFRAYASRTIQLRQKGMIKEADAIGTHLLSIRSDARVLSEDDLVLLMSASPLQAAVTIYGQHIGSTGPSLKAEYLIASRLLTDPRWDLLDVLSDASPLKRDSGVFPDALKWMNQGQWEKSLEVLRSVSRTSPIAPLKMLCRAMACFYAGDEGGMTRALSMIPASFPILSEFGGAGRLPQALPVLWEGRQVAEDEIHSLLSDLKAGSRRPATDKIRQISRGLYPPDYREAVREILQMIMPLGFSEILEESLLQDLSKTLLPIPDAAVMMAQYYFLAASHIPEWTAEYLKMLDHEFQDPSDLRIASSLVLTDAACRISKQRIENDFDHLPDRKLKRLGITSNDAEAALIEMTLKAIELDPQNRSAYELLANLPRNLRKSKQLAEQGLLQMLERFPDDPEPCLALSRLHYEKNAFRQAEAMLETAMKRAPYDERVREYRIGGLLHAIERNLQRKKLHIVKQDLEKAVQLTGKKTKPRVAAKQVRFEMEQCGQLPLFGGQLQSGKKETRAIIETVLYPMALFDRFKTLGFLAAEARQGNGSWDREKIRQLDSVFRAHAARMRELPSAQIRRLLVPEEDRMPYRMEPKPMISVFLDRQPKILNLLLDEDVFPVLEAMLASGLAKTCAKEIRTRQKTAKKQFDRLLAFYSLVVDCITGKKEADSEAFEKIVDPVEDRYKESFRTASRRLSAFAQGRLKAALEHFDFTRLNTGCTCPICSGRAEGAGFLEPDDFDENDDPGEFPWGEGNPLESAIAQIEQLVDDTGLRGAPEKIIRKRRRELFNNFQMRMALETFAELMPGGIKTMLSREACLLVWG
ncbi:MAG: tetratricopeptide repeat protein [Desulfobacteraceae bacterium]|nr:MAG: tetratricopeptide repeat protein [Desulfobacteraceae bacterium]